MDYFGEVLEEINELYESILSSSHVKDAGPVLKALARAMAAASKVETARTAAMAAPPEHRRKAA